MITTPFDRKWPVATTLLRAFEAGNDSVIYRCAILSSALAMNSPLLPRMIVRWWLKAVNGVTD